MVKYTPKMEDPNINVAPRDNAKTVVMLMVFTLSLFAVVIVGMYFGFQWALQNVSLENEKKWFSWFDGATGSKTIIDEEMNDLFLRAGIDPRVSVRIRCDQQLNAFAWPGGKIVLTSKLLQTLNSEEGLAFVLGHEMGHIHNRDHLRGMARVLTFLVIDMFTGASQWPGINVLYGFLDSVYSREQELQADKHSIEQMKTTYGHTKGGDEFFIAIQSEPQEKLHRALWFVSTHPLTADRLKYFENQNKDFLSERTVTSKRDLFDKVLCNSGCDPSACHKDRSNQPKSQNRNKKYEPITLKDF